MATFKFYNLQLLPVVNAGNMVGAEGYKKLFKTLSKEVKECVESKNLSSISMSLANDFYISPVRVSFFETIAYGKIIKYDQVNSVFDTLNDEEKYVSSGGESSKKYEFRYAFDFERHIFAIEDAKGLPSASVLIEFISAWLGEHASSIYPDYSLKVIELTDSKSLQNVFEQAVSYKKVEVDITFSNSEEWDENIDRALLEKIESEMKDNRIDVLHHVEKSSKNSSMLSPSQNAIAYLSIACKFGNAKITYNNSSGVREYYKMIDYPIREKVSDYEKGSKKTDSEFFLDLKQIIHKADRVARNAVRTFNKIRGVSNE